MSICDRCIHDEVCGIEDNHEEAIKFCADMMPKIDVLNKIRAEIQKLRNCSCSCSDGIIDDVEEILDKYKAEIK